MRNSQPSQVRRASILSPILVVLMLAGISPAQEAAPAPPPGPPSPAAPQAPASSAEPASNRPQIIRVDPTSTETFVIRLIKGHSAVLEPTTPVRRISIAEPLVADVEVLSPQQVLIVGKAVGSTDLTLWGDNDQTWQARIQVEVDASRLEEELQSFFPGSDITVRQRQDVLVVSGTLRRAEHAKEMDDFLQAAGIRYVNMTSVAGVQQVLIQVRVAEANRQAVRALGVNFVQTGEDFFGGSAIGGAGGGLGTIVSGTGGTSSSVTSVISDVTLFGGFPGADLNFFLEALTQNQYMRVLAEPTLVALSGEEASFLAGGEFPIPVVQGAGAGAAGGGNTSISVEFKEFGVRLRFRPVVLGDGAIRLEVAPEVSNLTDVGAVTINGFRVPALQTRRAQTTLEMKSGQTFAMAGLLDRRITANSSGVPGVNEVPILGTLFRSVRYAAGDTELLVLATVALVEPVSTTKERPVPGDLHTTPTDWELYAEGEIEGRATRKLSPGDSQSLRDMGLDRLQGPGAWATHGQPAAPSLAPSSGAPRPPRSSEEPPPQPLIQPLTQPLIPAEPQEPTPAKILAPAAVLAPAAAATSPAPHINLSRATQPLPKQVIAPAPPPRRRPDSDNPPVRIFRPAAPAPAPANDEAEYHEP